MNKKLVTVAICANVTLPVSAEFAKELAAKGGAVFGEEQTMKVAQESNDVSRLINELKAHGAESVWLKHMKLGG